MTKHDTTRRLDISEKQSIAIDLLLTGLSVTQVAETLNVSRQTVSVWIHHHVPFIAESNRRRKLRNNALTFRCEYAMSLALDLVVQTLEEGDTTFAHQVFRQCASHLLNGRTSPGPESTNGVVAKLADEQMRDLLLESIQQPEMIFSVEDQSHNSGDD
jgi:hypothetical protein